MFWFTFNLAVDLRPKMALTLDILSDQMHTLPRNSAEQTLFLFFASFRRSKSALRHLLCEATCSLRTDKQLGNNVTSVDEYSTIGHVRYINIQAWLRGFRVKIANFSSFFCLSIPTGDLDTKKTTPNIDVRPESLGPMLEY